MYMHSPSPHPHVEFSSFFQTAFHGNFTSSVSNDVPDATVSGFNISQQLQDIYIKTKLFYFHIEMVEKYHDSNSFWRHNKTFDGYLTSVKDRLSNLSNLTGSFLNNSLKVAEPTPPAPPKLSHTNDYPKKIYGWGVIHNLNGFLEQVMQVLQKKCKE